MTNDQREIRRKLRILAHAEVIGDVSKTCRYFGVGRASFYRWRDVLRRFGEAGLANKRSVPHNHPNKTPTEVCEKVLPDISQMAPKLWLECARWWREATRIGP